MKYLLTTLLSFISLFAATAQNIPIDFEEAGNGADWVWTVFENDTNPMLEIISNPDSSALNPSTKVAKFTALQTGQPFVGCESLHGAGIGSFTIDESNAIIRIKVWKSVISDVGIKLVRFDNWSLGEIKIPNTTINEWEQIEFDFSSHIGNTYDQIVIFPDFNERTSDNVIYFDDIYGDIAMTTSTSELAQEELISIFPNPSNNLITIKSNTPVSNYEIYTLTGQLMVQDKTSAESFSIDIASLPKGIYLFKASMNGEAFVKKITKL